MIRLHLIYWVRYNLCSLTWDPLWVPFQYHQLFLIDSSSNTFSSKSFLSLCSMCQCKFCLIVSRQSRFHHSLRLLWPSSSPPCLLINSTQGGLIEFEFLLTPSLTSMFIQVWGRGDLTDVRSYVSESSFLVASQVWLLKVWIYLQISS